jgi:Xaa-Pro aminopeptidase
LMTRALEAETVKVQWTRSPRLYKDHESAYDVLRAILQESGNGGGALGIEAGALKLRQFWNMQRILPGAAFKDVSGLVESVAAYPSSAEIDCMRGAGRIADIGLKAGLAAVADGVFPYEIIGRIHESMYAAGQSDFDKSLVAVWSGPKGGRMHDTLTTEKIKSGDSVTIEVMGVDNHYRAGAQTTVFVGDRPPPGFAETYDLVFAMHAAAKRAIRAGAQVGQVFDAANRVYRPSRGDDYYRRCGGSMGLTQFTIDLVKGGTTVLNPGVSLLVQTLVSDPLLIACASTVLVAEDGCIDLTSLPGGAT